MGIHTLRHGKKLLKTLVSEHLACMKKMFCISAALTAWLTVAIAGRVATSPGPTKTIIYGSIQPPEPTAHANLLVRSGYTKICGYENGDPRA
jgi:hypothetical protein